MDKKNPKLNLSERLKLAFLYGDLNPTTDSEKLNRRAELVVRISGVAVTVLKLILVGFAARPRQNTNLVEALISAPPLIALPGISPRMRGERG